MKPLNHFKFTLVSLFFSGLIFFCGCKKFVTVPSPVTELTSGNVYKNDNTAIAVLTGLYANLASSSLTFGGNLPSMSYNPALSSDELNLFTGSSGTPAYYFSNSLTSLNTSSTGNFWQPIYNNLFTMKFGNSRSSLRRRL